MSRPIISMVVYFMYMYVTSFGKLDHITLTLIVLCLFALLPKSYA